VTPIGTTPDNIAEIMTSRVVTVRPDEPVAAAIRAMIGADIGSVVVLEEGRPVGMFTERDLTRQIIDHPGLLTRPVREVMSSPVVTCEPQQQIDAAFEQMNQRSIRRLPVVTDGHLVGIVTERDLLRWVGEVMSE